jgi:hypothetical protein
VVLENVDTSSVILKTVGGSTAELFEPIIMGIADFLCDLEAVMVLDITE